MGVVHEREIGTLAKLKIDAWARYVGSSRPGVGPILGERQGSYADSGVSTRIDLGRVAISADITNLADTRGNRFALGPPSPPGVIR